MDPAAARRLKPFLERVRRRLGTVRFILFGSRARGDALKDSDYDLLVVSAAFSGIRFYERHVLLYSLQRERLDIDVICLTPEEFTARSKELSVVGIAAREGVELAG